MIFDLDGVIVQSEERWDAARRELAAEAGREWPEGATEAMMGMSSPEWSAYVRDELGVPLTAQEVNTRVVERLLAGYEAGLPLIPGAVDAVKRVAALGRPLGLASSSNREVIDLVLDRAGIAGLFSATVSSEEVARGKPSPDVYLEALARLAVEPAAATAVEDSSNGLRAAAAAGMRVVAVPHPAFPPAPDALALADVVLADLGALDAAAVLGE